LADVISSFLATSPDFYSKDIAEDTLRDYI